MRITVFILLLFSAPLFGLGQTSDKPVAPRFPKHYISVNPLNILLFQQAGITYEFKPGRLGYGINFGVAF
jgi:hypothetical protein